MTKLKSFLFKIENVHFILPWIDKALQKNLFFSKFLVRSMKDTLLR